MAQATAGRVRPDADDEIDAVLLEQLGILAGVLGARGAHRSARRLETVGETLRAAGMRFGPCRGL